MVKGDKTIMKGLIIAAGKGSRITNLGDSKPLIPLLDKPLIQWVITNFQAGGIDDIAVVSGYNGEKVRSFLDGFCTKNNIKITHIINDEWELGNGLSVLKAKKFISENFILSMSDHIFDPAIIGKIKKTDLEDKSVKLGVDYRIEGNDLIDIDDVTKVLVQDNAIADIGKTISDYNAFDTGLFLCSPGLFTALEESIAKGNDSLSGGMLILSDRDRAGTFDIGNSFWIDVDDEAAYKKAEALLKNKI